MLNYLLVTRKLYIVYIQYVRRNIYDISKCDISIGQSEGARKNSKDLVGWLT